MSLYHKLSRKNKFMAPLPIINFTFKVYSPDRELHRYSKESEILNFEIKKKKSEKVLLLAKSPGPGLPSCVWKAGRDDGEFEACLGCTGRLLLKINRPGVVVHSCWGRRIVLNSSPTCAA